MATEFRNEPLCDFTDPGHRRRMEAALAQVGKELGREYPCVIDGQSLVVSEKLRSTNPADPNQVVGIVSSVGSTEVGQAIAAAMAAFGSATAASGWRYCPAATRADYLLRAAVVLRRRRYEFAAWMIYEVGKTWGEADAEVAEAIDFCEFYARESLRYGTPQSLTPVAGERNLLVRIPLGVGVVLPPWNFPLAILTGMTTAAWVTGNTVVLKPSSEAPVVAAKFMEVIAEIGLPTGVVNFVTGRGAVIGDRLVQHPRTRFVAFTGSKAIGLRIVELAAKVQPGQQWIKRVIAEMGGKDAIVVDDEADLDAAVEGVVQSAYGFQGQKCSACSRAIVTENVYDDFLRKLTTRVGQIRVGPPTDPAVQMGPVVSAQQCKTVAEYIAIGKEEGRLLAGGTPTTGFFIPPTIVADVAPTARIAQEEIFGPVLAVIKARDFDAALSIANDTEYGLTGGVYTRNPAKIERAKAAFHVGNLYINRKCTGALVGAHPFGGFNMSGTNAKAGGADYLLHFLQAKTVAEKA